MRFRANFKQTAAITINGANTRASGTYLYYVRFSLVQTGANVTNDLAVIDPPDIAGDKKAFGPDQTKLSADLSYRFSSGSGSTKKSFVADFSNARQQWGTLVATVLCHESGSL